MAWQQGSSAWCRGHLGSDSTLSEEAALCPVECFKAPLASSRYLLTKMY